MSKAARNAGYTKEYNRKLFLRLLRGGPLSRAEIARQMGLTRAATSLIAEELLQEGKIKETAPCGTPQLGRTPVPLALRQNAAYAIGIYLNRSGCTIGLVDLRGDVLLRETLDLGDQPLQPLIRRLSAILAEADIPADRMAGIGISAPGPLDGENGRILNPPHFSLWQQTDIGPVLEKALSVPVYLENDASCLARYHLGKAEAQGSENFLLLLADGGIGSGVITKGKVLKGAGYFTSELGHISINHLGPECVCGNRGCLELYASIPHLLQGSGYHSWQQVIGALPETEALQLVLQEAEYLAAGITTMSNLVSIDTVLLAGDLLIGAEQLAPVLEAQVNRRILRRDILPIRVLPGRSDPDDQIKAAADAAFDRYLMV